MQSVDQWQRIEDHTEFVYGVFVGTKEEPLSFDHGSVKNVIAAREGVCRTLGITLDRTVSMEQVHGTNIQVIGQSDHGRGSESEDNALRGIDAMVTKFAETFLVVKTADCVPICFAVPERGIVAVAHAGWRGTGARIAQHTLLTLRKEFDVLPKEVLVHLGPSINACCYDITNAPDRAERIALFRKHHPEGVGVEERNGGVVLHLWQALTWQLQAAGVPKENIELNGICTHCHPEKHPSHRREGNVRRLLTIFGRHGD